jgi:NhaP-type Na+/H+ or K+/H+ antiporter
VDVHSPSFTFDLALAAGVAAQLASRHLRLPSIVLLLATGVVLGPDGLGWLDPRALGEGLFGVVALAVAVILFEGALNLDLRRLRREGAAIRRLVTLGAFVTALGGGLAAHAFMGWPLGLSLLFGTLVIVTGPTVIRPLLRFVPVRPRLATLLEAEGLLIDPVGAIVAAVTLQVVSVPTLDAFASGVVGLVARLGFGLGAGLAAGVGLVALLRWPRAIPEGLENLVVVGGVLIAFELCEAMIPESGILAAVVAGVVVGNLEARMSRSLGEFQEHLTIGLIGVLFVLLAADVRVADVLALGAPGLWTVAALALVVRPVDVMLCTAGTELRVRERIFLSWIGPRGVVAAAIASLAAAFLESLGVPEAGAIRALVFLTIAVTVVVQGGSAPLVARLLGVRAPGRDAIAILGAEELALRLGEVLRRTSPVVFVDSNPNHCRAAEERGFAVVYGNAVEERTLARVRLERARAAVALTTNSDVNLHFVGDAREGYGVPECYLAIALASRDVAARIAERTASRVLFDRPKDVERWNVRLRHGAAAPRRFRFGGRPGGAAPPDDAARRPERETMDPYAVLAVCRSGAWQPMYAGRPLEPGDEAEVLVHLPEDEKARAALGDLGWTVAGEAPDEETAQPGGKSRG